MAVQALIYKVDLAYQPTRRATRPAALQTGATPVWRMEESSRHNFLSDQQTGHLVTAATACISSRKINAAKISKKPAWPPQNIAQKMGTPC